MHSFHIITGFNEPPSPTSVRPEKRAALPDAGSLRCAHWYEAQGSSDDSGNNDDADNDDADNDDAGNSGAATALDVAHNDVGYAVCAPTGGYYDGPGDAIGGPYAEPDD